MDDNGLLGGIVNTPGGIVGATTAAVLTAAALIRKFLLSDKVSAATANANVDIIEKLTAMVERAEKRADAAETRADTAYAERNIAIQEIGALREQVRSLQATVEKLEKALNDKPNQ
jgi:hypothetical protein